VVNAHDRRAYASVGGTVGEIHVAVIEVRALHEDDVLNVTAALPVELRHEQRCRKLAAQPAGVVIQQRHVHGVGTIGPPFVVEEQEPLISHHGRGARPYAESARRWAKQGVRVEVVQVIAPVLGPRVPQVVEIVKHGQLHVGVDAVDERDPLVAQGKDDGVLVLDPGRSEELTSCFIEMEPIAVPTELVGADAPRLASLTRGQVGVGHHNVLVAATLHSLHAGIFEAVDISGTDPVQDVAKLVRPAVDRGEDQNVRDVVEESGSGFAVSPIALANSSRKEVEHPFVVEQPCVEHRPVARHGIGFNDGPVVEASGVRSVGHAV